MANILTYQGLTPQIDLSAWVAPTATIVGAGASS
jgi:carbonic anhydrase/acetyltransferase-like protein (isoleucine patch superfamily)